MYRVDDVLNEGSEDIIEQFHQSLVDLFNDSSGEGQFLDALERAARDRAGEIAHLPAARRDKTFQAASTHLETEADTWKVGLA
jgi:acyl-CoA reductase-like NAD-dependent aldehyde dehydrogenase